MLLPHTFDEENHLYLVKGEFSFSTSMVIKLNNLDDLSTVPDAVREHAKHRGKSLHLAIYASESGASPEEWMRRYDKEHEVKVFDEVAERLVFYLRWKGLHKVRLAAPMEVPRVYRHAGTELAIGATIDMPAWVDDQLYVLDIKTAHKNYGERAKMDHLKWRLQLQSYVEALEEDNAFLDEAVDGFGCVPEGIKKAILHLHPECGKTGVKGGQTGWEFHQFDQDDSFLWDAAIRMAQAKYSSGYRVAKKTDPAPVFTGKGLGMVSDDCIF